MHRLHHKYQIIQYTIIFSVLSFLLFCSLVIKPIPGPQELSLKSSVLISIGLGASFCMLKNNRNKEKKIKHYT
jgi:hypothetical protein